MRGEIAQRPVEQAEIGAGRGDDGDGSEHFGWVYYVLRARTRSACLAGLPAA